MTGAAYTDAIGFQIEMQPSSSRHRRSLSTPVDVLAASDLRAKLSVAFDGDDDDEAYGDVYEDMDEEVAKLFDAKVSSKRAAAAVHAANGMNATDAMMVESSRDASMPLDMLGDEIPMDVKEIALTDPKRARRILANRQSAARSKERKLQYLNELETRAAALGVEENTLRKEEEELRRLVAALGAENSAMEMFATTTNTSVNTSNGNGGEGASRALEA